MAVRALPRFSSRASHQATGLPVVVLGLALAPTAFDLLSLVQSSVNLGTATTWAAGLAMLGLVVMWLRFPRTSWLAAAAFAALAGYLMRMLGANVAPVLSLLSIFALGIGGAFASSEISPASI